MIGAALLALFAAPQSLAPFDEAMAAFMKDRGVPGGALAVVKDGRLVHARGYGWADEEAQVPVAADSLFRIASISKPVTAVAVLALVRERKLDLEAKAFGLLGLKPILKEGAKADPRLAEITVRQLLQHTAGWDREKSGDPMFMSRKIAEAVGIESPATADAVLRYMAGQPLDFDPGTRYAYSNLGYCALGRILEKVSGEGYEACVRKRVLEPMGIARMRLGRSLLRDRAEGEVKYLQPDPRPARSVFDVGSEVPWPYGGFCLEAMDAHGGWLASAVDLARFASSLGKVLDAQGLDVLFARPPGLKPGPVYYSCGWFVRAVGEGRRNTWHGGSLPGTNTLLVRRHDGLAWAALFNRRSAKDGEIDGALHRAADAVKAWPTGDLFGR